MLLYYFVTLLVIVFMPSPWRALRFYNGLSTYAKYGGVQCHRPLHSLRLVLSKDLAAWLTGASACCWQASWLRRDL